MPRARLQAPTTEPDSDTPEGGRIWRWLADYDVNPGGGHLSSRTAAWMYFSTVDNGWHADLNGYSPGKHACRFFPDGFDPPGPCSREYIEAKVKTLLEEDGFEVVPREVAP